MKCEPRNIPTLYVVMETYPFPQGVYVFPLEAQ